MPRARRRSRCAPRPTIVYGGTLFQDCPCTEWCRCPLALRICDPRRACLTQIKQLFEAADVDKSNYIEEEEMQRLLAHMKIMAEVLALEAEEQHEHESVFELADASMKEKQKKEVAHLKEKALAIVSATHNAAHCLEHAAHDGFTHAAHGLGHAAQGLEHAAHQRLSDTAHGLEQSVRAHVL